MGLKAVLMELGKLGIGTDIILRIYQEETHSSLKSDKNTEWYTRRTVYSYDNTLLKIS